MRLIYLQVKLLKIGETTYLEGSKQQTRWCLPDLEVLKLEERYDWCLEDQMSP